MPDANPLSEPAAPYDVLIIGAGISGIGCACYLQREAPDKRWAILEARDSLGGTWDLFKYPGIRSDSDLYTFSYDFKPWTSANSIAPADEIMGYLREAAAEHSVDQRISYGRQVVTAEWDSSEALWRVTARNNKTGTNETYRCRWLFGATGYYDYDEGFRPQFIDEDLFKGPIIHPQFWPDDFDYTGKRIAIIGSGATAVTLLPSLTDKASHVIQVQRTPTYIMPRPQHDPVALWLKRWLPAKTAYALTRWKNTRIQWLFYRFCQKYPNRARKLIRRMNEKRLPAGYPVDLHFNPPYNPWDQRLCAVPDSDYFNDISAGKASIETGHIDRFTPSGIKMTSGEQIDADAIIVATGLKIKMMGGVRITIDGADIDVSERLVYKGMMLDSVPNFAFATGYTNSSWTLKVGLVCKHFCKILAEMDRLQVDVCTPVKPDGGVEKRPLLDFDAGYVKRAFDEMPKQGDRYPWRLSESYISDLRLFKREDVHDPALKFTKAAQGAAK